jgi:small subunit ribosomal protein S14
MAKKSMIEREKKRLHLVNRFFKKRTELKNQIKSTSSFKEQLLLSVKLQKLPRNSSVTRLHNRCFVTGRPKGYFRDFGISRHVLREMAHKCLLPGVTKASW